MKILKNLICGITLLTSNCICFADDINVAVSGNFSKPLKLLSTQFELETGHKLLISVGSTGKLFTQITHGAPFEIFLAADQIRPAKLIEQQLAVKDSQFTYAKGKLALWSQDPDLIDSQGNRLTSNNLIHLAIANPKIAPYGEQAVQVLKHLGIYVQLKDKLLYGQNVGQVFQYLSSGNVRQGIIPLSQVTLNGTITSGSAWIIPSNLYQSIKQDAVLLNQGKGNPAAHLFINFLKSPQALSIIRSFGYEVDPHA